MIAEQSIYEKDATPHKGKAHQIKIFHSLSTSLVWRKENRKEVKGYNIKKLETSPLSVREGNKTKRDKKKKKKIISFYVPLFIRLEKPILI